MKKIDQVDCTVLGTVGSCILKILPLTLTILHYNVQQQTGTDLNVSLHVLIRIQDQNIVSFFWVGSYITDHPVCLIFENNYTNEPWHVISNNVAF